MVFYVVPIRTFPNLSAYKGLGCWRESPVGGWAIPYSKELSASKLLHGDYANHKHEIHRCFLAAYAVGYDIFALEGGGRCIGYRSNAQPPGVTNATTSPTTTSATTATTTVTTTTTTTSTTTTITTTKKPYQKHGSSVHCEASGKGGGASMSVYQIVQGKSTLLLIKSRTFEHLFLCNKP